jgi:hypothetical protein
MTCAEVADLFDELALDTLPGDLRAAAFGHLTACTACRTVVEELSATADALLLAAPLVEPPAGFDLRVRRALHDRQEARQPARQAEARRRRRPLATAAVAAAAALVVALSGRGILMSGSGTPRRPPLADSVLAGKDRDLRTAKLVAPDGHQLGEVSVYAGSPAWFFMRVDRVDSDASPASYRCVLDIAGGPSVALGDLSVSHGKGAWGQHVALGGHQVRAARLVDDTGATVATASFGGA